MIHTGREARMAKQNVMSVMAVNRVWILAALATALDELRGSFVDVSQAIMRQYFSMIIAAEFPDDRDPAVIVEHIQAVCRPFGGVVTLKDPEEDTAMGLTPPVPGTGEEETPYLLRITGSDRPGVLRRVAHRLAQDGIDVVDLYGIRHDEDQTFVTCLQLAVPVGVNVVFLQKDLDQMLGGEGLSVGLFHDDVLQAISQPEPQPVLRTRMV
jgi:glycine cleavage system transcriptional repressor